MTLIDKLEIGLKEDAPFRRDNLPAFQVRGVELPAGPGRSPEVPASRTDPVSSSDDSSGSYPDGATREPAPAVAPVIDDAPVEPERPVPAVDAD